MSKTKKTIIETLIMLIAVGLMFGGYLWFKDYDVKKYENIQTEEYQKYTTMEDSKEKSFPVSLDANTDNPYDCWTYPRYKEMMENTHSSYAICDGTCVKYVSRNALEAYLASKWKLISDKNCEPFQNGYTLNHIEAWIRDTLKHMTDVPKKGHILPASDQSDGGDIRSTICAFRKSLSVEDIKSQYIKPSGMRIESCVSLTGLKLKIEDLRIQKIVAIPNGGLCVEIDATVETIKKPNNIKDEWIPDQGKTSEKTFILIGNVCVKDARVHDIAVKGYN